ncbi:hypothetical protein [Stigmatella aurantiaca]|uniref:hypothetical protein n=1 Tax=Stigmatella aurantiaca TaxID=41 RepID=UPI0002E91FBE|nr:hypothetical protein [Stigmatella aurantiaca]
MLLALLALGPACGEALSGEPSEEGLLPSRDVAALADANLSDSFTQANSAITVGSLIS